MRASRFVAGLLASLALAACAETPTRATVAPTATPTGALHATHAYVGGTVIPSPGAAPIADAVVLVDGARIVAVGPRASTPIPPAAKVVACDGALVVAGFWNAHVHFTEPSWEDAATAPAAKLEAALDDLVSRWGFVHVVDTGSYIVSTLALRRRIDAGELRGPSILTAAGTTFVAVGGQPK